MKKTRPMLARVYIPSAVLFLVAWLSGWWVFGLSGVVAAALLGRWWVAGVLGLLLDLVWGAPYGMAQSVPFPFAAIALLVSLIRAYAGKHMFDYYWSGRI